MSTECSRDIHWNLISGIVQWPFSERSVPLNAAEWQAHFSDHSVTFFYLQWKISFFFYQIRGFRVILLWITTHEIIKKNWGGKHAHGQGRSQICCSLWLLICYVTSSPRCFISVTGQWIHFSQFELRVNMVLYVCSFLHNFFIIDVISCTMLVSLF